MGFENVPNAMPNFPDYYDLERPIIILKDFFKKKIEKHDRLFCYRCGKHIEQYKKKALSTMYKDIEDEYIEDYISFCPRCNNEVYDPDYELLVLTNNEFLKTKKYNQELRIRNIASK